MFKDMNAETLMQFKIDFLTYLCANEDLSYLADGNVLQKLKVISLNYKSLQYTLRIQEYEYAGTKTFTGEIKDFLVSLLSDSFIITSKVHPEIPVLMLDTKTSKIINKNRFFNDQFLFMYQLGVPFKEVFTTRMEKYQEELKNVKS